VTGGPAIPPPEADSPSPQELAQTILDHEFTPENGAIASASFREQLLSDADDPRHPAAKLLAPLIELADGFELSPLGRRDLAHALEITAAYKADSARWRDMLAARASSGLPHCPTTDDGRRAAQDEMASFAVEIGNLSAIEKLLRALAAHPGVQVKLIEPGRGRAGGPQR
jgi:hypothetical protein